MIPSIRKPRAGLLLLSPERFADIGQGTARGSYQERKEAEAAWMVRDCAGDFDVTFPGIVWNTQDVKRAMDAFVAELKAAGIREVHFIGDLEQKLDFVPGYVRTPWMISGVGILYGRK